MKVTPEHLRGGANVLWHDLRKHYEARLETLRRQNDAPMVEEQRNRLLGQIQEIKALLQLDQPDPEVPPDED